MDAPTLELEFCGEWIAIDPTDPFIIGREGNLAIDDNRYLHRRFLEVRFRDGLWWLANVGRQLSATVSDDAGRFQGWLAPGAHLPVVFGVILIRFTAGSTSYALSLHLADAPLSMSVDAREIDGTTTLGRVVLQDEQHLLLVALAEPILRAEGYGRSALPSSASAAARLGWSLTKFNRKLDNVCQKLKKAGVRGLHGDVGQLASDRRARLVEYALAARLVTPGDLKLLEQ